MNCPNDRVYPECPGPAAAAICLQRLINARTRLSMDDGTFDAGVSRGRPGPTALMNDRLGDCTPYIIIIIIIIIYRRFSTVDSSSENT